MTSRYTKPPHKERIEKSSRMRVSGIVVSLIFTVLFVPPPAVLSANSPDTSRKLAYGQSYVEAETDTSQSASGNGCFATTGVTINNAGELANSLEEYILGRQPDSPFANLGDSIVGGAQQDNVNPLLLVGVMQKESMLGTVWGGNSPDTYNAFGRRSGEAQPTINGWYRYDSWEQSLDGGEGFDDIPNYIRRVYTEERRAVSIRDFVREYASVGNNNTNLYMKQLRQSIEEMIELAGSSIKCGSGDNWIWPLEDDGTVISCSGSRTAPPPIGPTDHTGIDIADDIGSPVLAANSGEVITARYTDSAGLLVEVRHSDRLITRYLHNSDILVNVGETVSAGQRVVHMGVTGNATRPFVHFEIIRDQQNVNPLEEADVRGNTVFEGPNCTSETTGGQI